MRQLQEIMELLPQDVFSVFHGNQIDEIIEAPMENERYIFQIWDCMEDDPETDEFVMVLFDTETGNPVLMLSLKDSKDNLLTGNESPKVIANAIKSFYSIYKSSMFIHANN